MEKFNSRIWKALICIAEILAGILLLNNPEGLISAIVRIGGVVLIIMGIVAIVHYFRTPVADTIGHNSIIRGILLLLLGIFLFCNAEMFTLSYVLFTLPIMAIIFAIDLIVMGVMKLQYVFDMIRMKNGHWLLMLISVVLSVVLGIMIIVNPFAATEALWLFTGISLIVEGVMDGIMSFMY